MALLKNEISEKIDELMKKIDDLEKKNMEYEKDNLILKTKITELEKYNNNLENIINKIVPTVIDQSNNITNKPTIIDKSNNITNNNNNHKKLIY